MFAWSTFYSLIFLSIVLLLYAFQSNLNRRNRKYSYRLMPNCLLTRYPIIFVNGKESIFYHGSYWNFIPQFLEDHGYEIFALNLPWRNSKKRITELTHLAEILISEKTPAHWIGDLSSLDELKNLSQRHPAAFRTMNIVSHDSKKQIYSNLNLILHNLLWSKNHPIDSYVVGDTQDENEIRKIGNSYLKLLIECAESDHHEGTTDAGPETIVTGV